MAPARRVARASVGRDGAPAASPPAPAFAPMVPGERLGSFFTQNKVLAGAAQVFLEKGIEAATIEDILVAAGVSRRTFYKAFSNKEDVLAVLHRELSELFLSTMRAAMASAASVRERLARAIDIYLLAAQRSGGLMVMLQGEAQRPGKLAERRRFLLDELTRLLQEGMIADGRALPDPLLLRAVLIGMEAVVRSLTEEGRLGDAEVERARAVLMRLAVSTLAEPGDALPPIPRPPGAAK